MARARFNADELGLIPQLGGLKCRCIFKAMAGHDPIIRVRRCHQNCRIGRASFDIVIGRIGPQHLEIRLFGGISLVVHPIPPCGKAVKAQHIHDADGWQSRGKQIWSLIGDSAN